MMFFPKSKAEKNRNTGYAENSNNLKELS